MRVLLINQVFWPDVAATAQHADDLARHLAEHGHEVHAIASRSVYGKKGAALPKRETISVDGADHPINVHRVGQSLFGKASIAARALDFGLFYLAATAKALTVKKPDAVVCFTTPPFIALLGWFIRLTRGSAFVYWLMDMYPDVAVACGVMKPASPMTRFFEAVNRFCLRKADATVVLGRCMKQRVLDKGIDPKTVHHIGVWSEPAEVSPAPRADNPYRQEWDLGDRFVVMYSGNFGLGHDVHTMLDAAKKLRDNNAVRFLFVGGGKKKPIVEAFVRDHGLTNCTLADYQPRENLGSSLSVADLHLASILSGVEGLVVPCKLFGIMAAERPCAFIGSADSELSRVLAENDAGFTVPEGDSDALVGIILDLAERPERAAELGANARAALASAYSREHACEQWRTLLESVAHATDAPDAIQDAHAPRSTP
ncbi:MAG: glycosyltransferase family 4 protein [Planctomycetota bacterium]